MYYRDDLLVYCPFCLKKIGKYDKEDIYYVCENCDIFLDEDYVAVDPDEDCEEYDYPDGKIICIGLNENGEFIQGFIEYKEEEL